MTTVKQYQDFCLIPTGSTEMTYINEVSKIIGINNTDYNQEQLTKKVTDWITTIIATQKKHSKVTLNGHSFMVDRDLYNLKFSQWVTFDSIMTNVDENTISQHLHEIIAVFLRPIKYKFYTKKYNANDHKRISELVQSHMDIRVALELTNFFFLYTINSMKNGQIDYLEKSEKMIWNTVNESKS